MAKITKVEAFEKLLNVVANAGLEEDEATELTDFLSKQIDVVTKKAERAKAKAAEKEPEPDELMDTVKGILNTELQTAEQIASMIMVDGAPVSRQKVSARLTKLVKAGVAEKGEVTNEETGKKYAGYKIQG